MPTIEPNWHPVVVHFVIALLSVAALLYAAAAFGPASRRDGARTAADWIFTLGIFALAAGVAAGFYAYFTVDHDDAAHRAMTAHRNLALVAAAAFAVLALWRMVTRAQAPNAVFALAGLAATAVLLTAAYKGGDVVYGHGVGVARLPEAANGDGHDHDHGEAVEVAELDHDAPPPAADTPEAAVAAFHAALDAGDAAAARALMADDVVILEGGGSERSFAEYASHHLSADMAFSAAMVRTITRRDAYGDSDVAWVVTESRIAGTFNGRDIDSASLETMILRREQDAWRIMHVHWS